LYWNDLEYFSFFSVSSMRSYILGHHSLFSICGFLIFQKKDKICFLEIQTNDNYLKYWFFIKTVVVMQIVYHLLRKTGHGISFKLRHPYSDIEIIATAMSFFNAIFFYFYPTFQGRFVGLLRSRLNVRILASIYSLLFTDT